MQIHKDRKEISWLSGAGGRGHDCLMGTGSPLGDDENVLKLDRDDSRAPLGMY